MAKKILKSGRLRAAGPYSAAVEAGGFIFLSGQLPVDPATGHVIHDIRQATHQVLINLQTLLEENGLSLNNVIKTTLFLTDMDDFAAVNEIYAGYFPADPPARSTVEVSELPKGVLIEIDAIAARE